MKKKYLPYMLLFVFVAAISIAMIILTDQECSLAALWLELKSVKKIWIFLAFLSMPGFIIFEGLALSCLVKGLCGKKHGVRGSVYAAADIYFSAITPSASGGQPASAFFMIRDGISAGKTTVLLLINLIMYSIALVACGAIAFLVGGELFHHYDIAGKSLIFVGSVVIAALVVMFWLLLRKKHIVERFIHSLIALGHKLSILKHPEKQKEKLSGMMQQYEECANTAKGRYSVLALALLFNVLQRISQSLVTVFCYLSLGGNLKNAWKVGAVHMFSALGANCIPIPGGVGATDYLLIHGFNQVGDITNASNLTLLCRGISFYGCISISALIILIGYIMKKKSISGGKKNAWSI